MRILKAVMTMLMLVAGVTASAQLEPQRSAADSGVARSVPVTASQPLKGGAALTPEDVAAWFDGFLPFAMERSNIAGGVVSVVKDGQIIFERGYGYADVKTRKPVSPTNTLFRPGSISKLFTWTAVMQLVEQGKIDLDKDVNAYLDFKIPPYKGEPVTMRNIMTHTAGFEEANRDLIFANPEGFQPLGQVMKDRLPPRIYPVGTTPAYSNYATGLAGYIVERVSGESFETYIDNHILRPLGMRHSTFRQPLPDNLKPMMSKGYTVASEEAVPYEIVSPAPAGSLASSAHDMAQFMIAHLNEGGPILRPETTRMMHETKLDILPQVNRMALGFYEQNVNGHPVLSHGGDTNFFHSQLYLFPEANVGVFVSINSAGNEGARRALYDTLLEEFADRYFPGDGPPVRGVSEETARQHAQMMAGTYENSRNYRTRFLQLLDLISPVTLGVKPDGGLDAPFVTNRSGGSRTWVEIAPFVWQDVLTSQKIAAEVKNGKVVRWSFDTVSPFMVFDRMPWYRNSSVFLPLFIVSLAVVLLTALSWPVVALVRRRYKVSSPYSGRALSRYRATRALCWGVVAAFVGWGVFIAVGLMDFTVLAREVDWLLTLTQFMTTTFPVGLLGFAAWSAYGVWTEGRGWFTRLWSVLLVLAAFIIVWVCVAYHLMGFTTDF